jgi:hypothetical protein
VNRDRYRICPGSVSGHAQNDASGRRCWCGRRVDPPLPYRPQGMEPTDLTEAYEEFYGDDDPEDAELVRRRYRLGQS